MHNRCYGALWVAKRKRDMKRNTIYRIEKIQAGAYGFGAGNLGLVLKNQKHPKHNHGLMKDDYGIYVQKSNGDIWKLNGNFNGVSMGEKITFYFEKLKYRLIEIKKILFRSKY